MAWDENKKIKFVIDHNKVDETLYDFPVTMKISDSCGVNLVDLTTTSGTTASGTIFEEATSALSPDYGFTGTDGDAPDWRQWYLAGINAMTYCSIQNNKLNWNCDTASDAWLYSNYELVGDFDVQIDFDLVTHPETNTWSLHFYLSGSNHGCYIIREHAGGTNRYRTGFYTPAGGSGGGTTTSLDHLTGKLRWVRTGGTVYAYYWTGSWVLMSTSPWSDCTEPIRLLIRPYQDSGPALVEYNIDNVQVNSGNVSWSYLRSKVSVFAGGDQNTGTRCFIDLEKFNTLDEEIVMHVGVPEISHTEDTELYLYYDEDYNTNANGYPFSWWASLTPEDASDSFTVSGTPNEALWYDRNTGSYVQNGRLVMDLSSGNTNDTLDSTYTIYGDFDIQVDYDAGAAPTTDGWFMGLNAWEANEDLTIKRIFMRRRYNTANGHHYDSGYHDGGGWTFANTATTSGSGKLRITREDHVMKMYYYDSGWQLAQTGTLTSLDNVPMRIKLEGATYTGEPTTSVYFDNFTINKAFIITDNYLASDTFPEPDYSQPNREKWRKLHGETASFSIKDNSLYVFDSGATNATAYNTHWLDGDFDVQVDFNLVSWPSTDVGWAYMRFIGRDNNNDYMTGYIGRRYEVTRGGNVYFTSFYDNSTWTGETNTATSDTTGKFRFYRDGNTIYAQYWNGASWTTTDSEDFDSAPEVIIYLQAGSNHATGVEVKYDNFKVNSARRIRGYMSGASAGSAAQVWDQTYRFVCHLGELYDDPTAGYDNRTYDASYWHNRGTATSNMTYSDKVDSQVGGGFEFDGTDDQITFSPYSWNSWRFDRPHAIEAVIKCDSAGSGSSRAIFTRMDNGGSPAYPGFDFRVYSDGRLSSYVIADWSTDAIQLYGETPNLHDDEYHYVAVRYDGSKDETGYTFYYDGQIVPNVYNVNTLTTDSPTYNSNVSIGSRDETNDFFYGVIDEVRASYGSVTTGRPDAHFKASYYTLFDDLLYIDWLSGPQGFDSTKYIQFFVDHTKIDTETLSNFPVRFRISKQSGIDNIDITRVFDELSYAARKKIAVTTADTTTQCYVEIENWDHDRENANLWIKAPSLSPQHPTEFRLYYDSTASDNTDWVGDTGDVPAQNVWDDKFVGVWHMAQEPTGADTILDSTASEAHATPNSMAADDLEDGRSGKALHFNGASAYVSIPDVSILNDPSSVTWEMVYKSDVADTTDQRILAYNDDGFYTRTIINDGTANRIQTMAREVGVDTFADETTSYNVTDWHYIAGKAAEGSTISMFVDDAEIGTANAIGTFEEVSSIGRTIGSNRVGTGNWADGMMDEVRFSSIGRTAAWLKATYYTLFDDMIYFRMPWDDTHSEIKLTVSGTLIDEDLTNFPLILTLASGVGTNTEDVTKIFDGLTLSGTLGYSDDFTGWNGDEPNTDLWYKNDSAPNSYMEIEGNRLKQVHDINDTVDNLYYSYFTISGDFDLRIKYELDTDLTTNSWWGGGIRIYAQDASGYWAFIQRGYSTTKHHRFRYNGDGGNSWDDVVTTLTSGTVRLTRSGSNLSAYYSSYTNPITWNQVGSATDWSAEDVKVALNSVKSFSSTGMIIYADDFTVVSGTVHADHTRKRIAIFSGGDQHTGDKCFTEIEYWDAVNETATLHVQVPTLTSGTDTDFYLYEDINQPDQDYRLLSEANDTFTAASGSYPDHTRWREDGGTNYFEIQNNKLYVSASSINKWLRSRYRISGDFEIHVDWDILLGPNTNAWRVGMWVTQEGGDGNRDYGLIYRSYESSAQSLRANFKDAGGWIGTTTYNTTVTTGKFRIRRVGTVMYIDYDIGAGWVNLKSQDFSEAPDVQVIFEAVSGTSNPSFIGTWDNFTVVSGTVTGFVGDTGETPAGEVWDQNFVGVWHMAQEPSGSDDILDSKAVEWNIADGTSQNMEAADLKDSQVGKALEFDGTAEWVDMDDFASADPGTDDLTVEILAKRNASGIDDYFISKGNVNSTLEGWSIWQENSTNALYVRCNASDDAGERASQTLAGGVLDTNWHTVALVLDHTDEKIYGYKDGSNSSWVAGGGGPADDDITSFDIDTSDELAVAAARDAASTSRYADATIDEVRISSTARTPGWIAMTHESLFDTLVFYDLLPPTPPTPPEPPTPSGLNDAAGWTSINDVLTSGIVVRLYRRTDGSLVGEDISATISGIWNIPTTYDELHYAIALYPVSGTNALIYDWLEPTTV